MFFFRASPDALSAYRLADCLAGGFGQGRHPSGARTLALKLVSVGYIQLTALKPERWRITTAGRDEAKRISAARHKAGRPSVLINSPPEWSLPPEASGK